MFREVVVTGPTGFLGKTLVDLALTSEADGTVVPIHSHRSGGVDLAQPNATERLETTIHLSNPQEAILIHAAALVEWDTPDSFMLNAAMALNIAKWARSVNIGFSVLVSTVSVNEELPLVDIHSPCQPANLYGLGKLAAEHIWRLILPEDRRAIVRLAGIWGWQRQPTLFWNRLLIVAARGSPPEPTPVLRRGQSRRNYISVNEAGQCLLQIGVNRIPGSFLAAGHDIIDLRSFVERLQELPDSKLSVDWQDDGQTDERIYRPSAELNAWLKPFPEMVSSVWADKPSWVLDGGR